jgi:hypothetical protein
VKIAILSDTKETYVKPLGEGLHRLLLELGVEAHLFSDGLDRLAGVQLPFRSHIADTSRGSLPRNLLRYVLKEVPSFYPFVRQLRQFDAVVIVSGIVHAYLRSFFSDESVRRLLPNVPLVLYDLYYLPTRGPWMRRLKEGSPEHGIPAGGGWGVERYDWFLVASAVSECAMPPGDQPYSLIGLHLDDGTLKPEPKKDFIALIDFEWPRHHYERAIQILACEKTQTKYMVLHGRYPMAKIREIYRQSSIYFIATRESFGLPICELQACGAYVFTAYSNWCPSHWVKEDIHREGPGVLTSPNFVVYNNDLDTLVEQIQRVKQRYDPSTVVDTFQKYHPHYFRGNKAELQRFLTLVEQGKIYSGKNKEYRHIPTPKVPDGFE